MGRTADLAPCILVVEDQDAVRSALRLLLKSAGYAMVGADSPAAAMDLVRGRAFAAAIVDMNFRADTTSGQEGLQLIEAILGQCPALPVIAMTAWASIDLAVEAMRRGAADFIEKPWQNARLLAILASCIALAGRRDDAGRPGAAQSVAREDDGELVAFSAPMRTLVSDLRRIAASDASILLLGENGTGKSLIASLLHRWSPRSDRSFVKIDIGGLSPTLFESEMFGHVRGAFTDARQDRTGRLEVADGGTLFLDEIGNLPTELQPKLLRAIESGEFERLGTSRTRRVDVRIVSATNADLQAEVAAGRFRQDLLYRLNTFVARVPALRERREDILPLARHYLAQAAQRYRRSASSIATAAAERLLAYPWPGNVRELAHVMERAVLLAQGGEILPADLRLTEAPPVPGGDADALSLDAAEVLLLRRALMRNGGHLQRTADQLGISRQSLYRRMEKHGIRGHGPVE